MYLRLMEQEKKLQRKRILQFGIGIGGALLLAAVVLWATLGRSTQEGSEGQLTYLIFQKAYLPHEQIFSFLSNPSNAVVIMESDLGEADTLSSAIAYQQWLTQHPEVASSDQVIISAAAIDTTTDALPDIENSPLGLVLRGSMVAERALTFIVSGYRPDFTYILDLGNGRTKSIKQQYTYLYRESGSFSVRLTARDAEGRSRTIQRRIEIALPPAPNEQLANNRPESLPELEVQTLVITDDEQDEFLASAISPEEFEQTGVVEEQGISEATGSTRDGNSPEPATEDDSFQNLDLQNHIFVATESPSSFPGGVGAMRRFLTRNIRFPDEAAENQIEGTVTVRFVVNKDGSLSGPEFLQRLGYGCEDEVLRVLNKMPKWKPGEIGGKAVRSYYVLPVSFSLL